MKALIAYLKFWWTSTNQHGVHSPFVYKLITLCFYNKNSCDIDKKISNPKARLLYRLITYFKFDHIISNKSMDKAFLDVLNSCESSTIVNTINEGHYKILAQNSSNLLFLDAPSIDNEQQQEIESHLDLFSNNTLILLKNIRANSKTYKLWCKFAANPTISVSIDTYYWGLLFVRKEQQKEHFYIRV